MIQIGDKIRKIRTFKDLSQENMAESLKMSVVAYGDIERNKKDISLSRLEQIAKILKVKVEDIYTFDDKVSNFFDQCTNTNVVANNHGDNITNHFDAREVQHKLDKANLEIEKLKAEREKAELEVKYWREKTEK